MNTTQAALIVSALREWKFSPMDRDSFSHFVDYFMLHGQQITNFAKLCGFPIATDVVINSSQQITCEPEIENPILRDAIIEQTLTQGKSAIMREKLIQEGVPFKEAELASLVWEDLQGVPQRIEGDQT